MCGSNKKTPVIDRAAQKKAAKAGKHVLHSGDVVRVKNATTTFGYYQNGDVAVINSIDADGDLNVTWLVQTPTSNTASKIELLHADEVELA